MFAICVFYSYDEVRQQSLPQLRSTRVSRGVFFMLSCGPTTDTKISRVSNDVLQLLQLSLLEIGGNAQACVGALLFAFLVITKVVSNHPPHWTLVEI